jgi:hypothetical protein
VRRDQLPQSARRYWLGADFPVVSYFPQIVIYFRIRQQQSYGMMVNYLYDPDAIDSNLEAFSREGAIATSGAVRRSWQRR